MGSCDGFAKDQFLFLFFGKSRSIVEVTKNFHGRDWHDLNLKCGDTYLWFTFLQFYAKYVFGMSLVS